MIDQLMGNVRDGNYELAKQLLDAASLRHEALARNVANVETPGYKRVDLAPDFARQLADFAAHPEGGAAAQLTPTLAEDRTALSSRPDGNNVQLDKELLEINRNALEYDFLGQYASDSLRRLKTAISGNNQ